MTLALLSTILDVGALVVNLLAVLGGAAAGGLGTGWTGQRLTKMTARRQLPEPVVRSLRVLGGGVSGFLTWLLIFGNGGGFGLGTGGLGLSQSGPGEHSEPDPSQVAPAPSTPQEKPPTTSAPATRPAPGKETVRVEMLGGRRYKNDERFYKVEGGAPLSLVEVLKWLREERERNPRLRSVEIVIYLTGSVAESHPAVDDLKEGARGLGLAVSTRVIDQDAP